MAHQTDEYCFTEKITEGTQLFENLIGDWCNS